MKLENLLWPQWPQGLYKKSSSGIIKRVGLTYKEWDQFDESIMIVGLKRGRVGLCLDSGIGTGA